MNINLEKISEIIEIEYGIIIHSIGQLNTGFDQNTFAYKIISTNHKEYFLKIRSENFSESSLLIPLLIFDKTETSSIIKIIKTIDNNLYAKYNSLYIAIYPFIKGQSGWEASLTKNQFIEFGNFMHSLHSIQPQNNGYIPKEGFNQKYKESVKKYLNNCTHAINGNTEKFYFLDIFHKKKKVIMGILNFLDDITKEIDYKNLKMCLCHGDIHAGNILIANDNFYIVDWDTVIYAPKEKDLMFIGAGIGNKWNKNEEIDYFYDGYGKEIAIDKVLIKYYRLERIIQDIYEFYNQIMHTNIEEKEYELCIKYFLEQFENNNVVENALK